MLIFVPKPQTTGYIFWDYADTSIVVEYFSSLLDLYVYAMHQMCTDKDQFQISVFSDEGTGGCVWYPFESLFAHIYQFIMDAKC